MDGVEQRATLATFFQRPRSEGRKVKWRGEAIFVLGGVEGIAEPLVQDVIEELGISWQLDTHALQNLEGF